MSTQEVRTNSEQETQILGTNLAENLFSSQPVFLQLEGPLGAGKSAFSRGFIRRWSELARDPIPDSIISPTYNIAKVYGANSMIAHLDLYRLKSMRELEQLGFEHYFYEFPCCLVEWLSQIPEAIALRPQNAVVVSIAFDHELGEDCRLIKVEGLIKSF